MNRNQKLLVSILGTALVLASAAAIFSQQKQPAEGTIVVQRDKVLQGPDSVQPNPRPDDTFYFLTSQMSFDGKLVKGAPSWNSLDRRVLTARVNRW